MRDKKKTISLKVRDLKPKKDAKGGVVANASTNISASRSTHSRQANLHI